MTATAFCVVDRPFLVWSDDTTSSSLDFLKQLDVSLYYRQAHLLFTRPDELTSPDREADSGSSDDQDRKDVSSIARLLWYHGVEMLVMMLGAYMQAPMVPYAYFLKCTTNDAVQLANLLHQNIAPKYHRLDGAPFSLAALLSGVNRPAGWPNYETVIQRFATALKHILLEYTDRNRRDEYNSIKNGLRATHGPFAIAIGPQEAPGIPASPEVMETIGHSKDASFFNVARPLVDNTKRPSKINFSLEQVSVTWSLEKVICDLQLISIFLHNLVSRLKMASGMSPTVVTFNKVADDEVFWDMYFKLPSSTVPCLSMQFDMAISDVALPSADAVFDSYKEDVISTSAYDPRG